MALARAETPLRLPRDATNPRAWTTLAHHPLVIVRSVDGFDMADMEECLIPNEAAILRGAPFVTLRDFRTLTTSPDALQRKRLANWQDEWRIRLRASCLGVATVSSSQLVRGAMKAIFWVSPPPIPEEVFGDLPSAARYLRGLLEAKSVQAPQLLRDLEAGRPLPY